MSTPAPRPTILFATGLGTGSRYFFQTDIIPCLLRHGATVVGAVPNPEAVAKELTDGSATLVLERLTAGRHERPMSGLGRIAAGCIGYLRSTGVSHRMNLAIQHHYRDSSTVEGRGALKRALIHLLNGAAWVLQRSRVMRRLFAAWLSRRRARGHYRELFERHRPCLVVVSSPGWFDSDEELLLEARAHGAKTVALVVGWDHTSSRGLASPAPDRICAWSDIQKRELVVGSDLAPSRVDVLGAAHFDGYRRPRCALPRGQFLASHRLDPRRSVVSFACSFVSKSSNVGVVRLLAEAIAADRVGRPAQLLVRLHPTHFKKPGQVLDEVLEEVDEYRRIASGYPHVHLDYPVLNSDHPPMSTARADLVALASLLRHSRVFVTLFSTMVLEAALTDTPTVCAALEPPAEWQLERRLPIQRALDWPTHERIIGSGAAIIAHTAEELVSAVRTYLEHPGLHALERWRFALDEATYLDGQSGPRIADYLWRLALE
jgi:hypothetical protein